MSRRTAGAAEAAETTGTAGTAGTVESQWTPWLGRRAAGKRSGIGAESDQTGSNRIGRRAAGEGTISLYLKGSSQPLVEIASTGAIHSSIHQSINPSFQQSINSAILRFIDPHQCMNETMRHDGCSRTAPASPPGCRRRVRRRVLLPAGRCGADASHHRAFHSFRHPHQLPGYRRRAARGA